MILEFKRAERMGDALDRIRLAVGEIVARINAPCLAGARMLGMQDAVEHRIAQVDVARPHVDLGAQCARAVGEFAGAHAAEQIEVFLDAAVAMRAFGPGLSQRAAGEPHLLLRLVVDISLAGADQMLGPFVQPLEIVRRVKEIVAPVEAEPAHVALDGVDIFLQLFGRIGVVVTQVAVATEFLGNAEIQADRLGVADMQISVRLGRKPGDDTLDPAGREIGAHDVADEILTRFACRRVRRRHGLIASCRRQADARRARIGQIGLPGQVRAS